MATNYTTQPTIERPSANVLNVRFSDVADGWERWLMLSSDRHHDSVICDRVLEKEHLEKALK
jgi:hypothetical protein